VTVFLIFPFGLVSGLEIVYLIFLFALVFVIDFGTCSLASELGTASALLTFRFELVSELASVFRLHSFVLGTAPACLFRTCPFALGLETAFAFRHCSLELVFVLGTVHQNLQTVLGTETGAAHRNHQTVLGIDSGVVHQNRQTVLGTETGVVHRNRHGTETGSETASSLSIRKIAIATEIVLELFLRAHNSFETGAVIANCVPSLMLGVAIGIALSNRVCLA